jgi:ubiquinone/menaquinone biosynthesis C-methylase UbiE
MSKERDLLFPAIPAPGGVWAELGSGTGIFTQVLRGLVGPEATIYSVDRDAKALEKQRKAMDERYPGSKITYLQADFTRQLDLPFLDGLLIANALHFVPFERQGQAVKQFAAYLKPDGGKLVIVEYDATRGNPWVPYPVDYDSFQYLAGEAGLIEIRRLAIAPSTFMHAMYSAMAVREKLNPP